MTEQWLVGDIGGTNARFALAGASKGRPTLHDHAALATADFASLQQAIKHYLSQVDVVPKRAALAVACPVVGDDIRLTNRAWAFNRLELQESLGLSALKVINDFGAAARGVGALASDEYEALYGPSPTPLQDPVSVIGPGTGMGVALLLRDRAAHWQVIETEGGHISFAALGTEERGIHDWMSARHGRVSIERALSGRGLSEIHAAMNQIPPAKSATPDSALKPPADIVKAALAGEDRTSRAALARFCAILGSVAGDAALFHGARTVAIAGGIVPRFIPFLKSSAFRERFLDKGRFAAHLERVSILVVTYRELGLLGSALSLVDEPSGGASAESEGL